MKGVPHIDDYVSGALSDADAERFEEELFAAPDDADVVAVDRFAYLGAHLASRGTFDIGMTRAEVEALERSGLRIQMIDIGPPGPVQIRLRRDVELIIVRYDVGLRGVDRVDVEMAIPSAGVSKTMRDVRVDPDDGAIYGACEAALALTAFTVGQVVTGGTVVRDGVPVSLSYVIDAVVEP